MDEADVELFQALKRQGYAIEMSTSRKEVLDKVESAGPTIGEHILKMVVYQDSKYVEGYIEEVAVDLQAISLYSVKPRAKKLKAEVYEKLLCSRFGDSFNDMKGNLLHFSVHHTRPNSIKKYPPFTVTSELVAQLLVVYTDVIRRASALLAREDEVDASEFATMIKAVLRGHGISC